MKNKIIVNIIIILLTLLIIGCTNSSITYQKIKGTSEEFSKDVYRLLQGFQEDINDYNSNNIDIYRNDSLAFKFKEKYSTKILNPREQKIFKLIDDAIMDVSVSTLNVDNNKYNREKHVKALKENAEKILNEIQK